MRKATAIFFLFVILMSGCRSTKYVPEGKYLLDNVTIESDNKEIKPNDVQPYVKQKANVKILGLVKFHLWLYNRAPKNKDGWVARILKKMGEEPVVYDGNYTTQSEREIKHYLSNKGFTNGEVITTIDTLKNKRKKDVTYKLICNTPYRIANTEINVQDTAIAHIIKAKSAKTLIHDGDLFDLDVLDEERERITADLKNTGYYDFNKEQFGYEIDTTIGNHQVNGKLILDIDTINPQQSYKKYHLNKIFFVIAYNAQKALKQGDDYFRSMDTVVYKDLYILSDTESKVKVKPEIIYRNNLLKPGELYNKDLSNKTHSMLLAMSIIRYVNINYQPVDTGLLDCNIYISLAEPQKITYEMEGTNISGNVGAAINIDYTHRNLFRGAEILNANFTIGREAIIGTNDAEVYDSKELSAEVNLTYPKYIFPFLNEDFRQKSRAQTRFGISFDYQERPEYTRNIATAEMVYSWKRSDYIRHQLTPLMLNYINIPEMTDNFEQHIDTTEYLKYSYDKHIIFGSRYSITFQDDNNESAKYNHYLRFMVESSGNMLTTFNSLINKEKETTEDGNEHYYDFLNLRYSQYIKFDVSTVLNHHINESNTMVYSAKFGIGVPYNNSSQLPFEKRYFGGGANGIRAWMVRSLGPGTYSNDEVNYYNQSGDINLILSAEYRFKLFWVMEGALFADAGNIWTIRNYTEQPGAVFKFDSFYKQIAGGVGTGIRLHINIFVFRLDFAWKALDPTQDTNDKWVLGDEWRPTTHIAIGYPF